MKEKFYGSLHNHTDFSNRNFRDSTNTVESLISRAVELGQEVLAITEHDFLGSAIRAEKFYEKIKKTNPNFKLILGNEIYLCRNGLNSSNFQKGVDKYFHFILLAKNAEGHKQIRQLSTRAWLRSYVQNKIARVPTYYQDLIEIIGQNKGNVIGSTACLGGVLPTKLLKYKETQDQTLYNQILNWCRQMNMLFGEGNFYLEMQPSSNEEQIYVNKELLKISKQLNIPYIITTDSHYLKKEDRPIHKAFLQSQNGDREVDEFYSTTYLMNTDEIIKYFSYFSEEDLSTAFLNIKKIKNLCEDYSLRNPLKIPRLNWKIPNLATINYDKWFKLIPNLYTFHNSPYEEDRRLADIIIEKISCTDALWNDETYNETNLCLSDIWVSSEANNARWSAYLLNLQNIIDCCWDAGSLVGAGRGSGVGFLLLYLLGITQINPLWEKTQTYRFRFLNPKRVSPLDIDVDIESTKRAAVMNKFREIYSDMRVANVLTLRTEAPKSAILTACLAPGTKINTLNGLKKIEDISRKDYVYTTNGLEPVLNPTYREYEGRMYSFNCSGLGSSFSVTHNHQLLVYTNRKKESYDHVCNYSRCQLVDANGNILGEFLSIKDAATYYATHYNGSYSSMYKYKATRGYKIIELPSIKNHTIQWLCAEQIKDSDYLLTPILFNNQEQSCNFTLSKKEQNPYNKFCTYIPESIELTTELAELIGIYLAEGNINTDLHGITFTINKNETWLKNRIIELLNKCFKIRTENISLLNKEQSEGLSIQVNSTPLGRWFNKYCSGLAKEKFVPLNIMNSDKAIQKALLYGCFFGDGYARKRNNDSYEAKITSISYQLIQDLWQIAANNHYNCSIITENRSQHSNQNDCYNLMFYGLTAESLFKSKYNHEITLEWEEEDYLRYNGGNYYKIKINNINNYPYKGLVYCLETISHNYLLNNIVSHNCRGLGIDIDIAQYLASMVESDRGIPRTLKQTFYGDEEAGFGPNKNFQFEMEQNYPELWEVAQYIEGLICGIGIHAGGVIFVDEDFPETCALMKAPNGEIITQYDLHDAEEASLIKYDILSINSLDKIHICLDLLEKDGRIEKCSSLREEYEKTVGIYNIERNDKGMWKMVWDHDILSLFQMEEQSGIQGIEILKPQSVDELSILNSTIRLMAQQKGGEMPTEKLARFKRNPEDWDRELARYGLGRKEKEILLPILGISYGLCITQEQFMMLVQLPELGGFPLEFADKLRKSIAKKNPAEYEKVTEQFFAQTKEKGCNPKLCEYVWNVLIAMSRGYGFKRIESLYSNV